MISLVRPECPNPAALDGKKYDDPVNKEALRKSTFGKCMYCESKIEHISYSEVEHIKPKKKYPELEFVWENLGISCRVCNNKKGQKFDEEIPFINPYEDNPEDHITFLEYYLIIPSNNSKRGQYTIKEVDLNRMDLIDRRKEKIEWIKKFIQAVNMATNESLKKQLIIELKKEADRDKEYSAAVKNLLIAQEV